MTTPGMPVSREYRASLGLRIVAAIIAAYLLIAALVYLWRGIFFVPDPPDTWAALLLIGAMVAGRWKAFLRDWIPFVALIFGYELLRGFTGTVVSREGLTPAHHGSVHWAWLLAADRWLGAGQPWTVRLQAALYQPGTLHWYDALAVVIYSLHFALPLVFAYILWNRSRQQFAHFAVTLLAMTYSTFVIFLLLPTAPPWLVSRWGWLPGVSDPFSNAVRASLPERYTRIDTITIWTKASPDVVAAFPSLHAAYPWLVLLFCIRYWGRRGWLFLPYNVLVWFSVVYLAQHWVVDIAAGIAWATLSFVLMTRWWDWRNRHQAVRFPSPSTRQGVPAL